MSKPIHIDLAEAGLPELSGQWLDLRDPRFLSKRTVDRWQAALNDGGLAPEQFVREVVAAWHLLDADNDSDLNDPAQDSLDGVPLAVFRILTERVQSTFRGAASITGDDGATRGVADGNPGGADAAR